MRAAKKCEQHGRRTLGGTFGCILGGILYFGKTNLTQLDRLTGEEAIFITKVNKISPRKMKSKL